MPVLAFWKKLQPLRLGLLIAALACLIPAAVGYCAQPQAEQGAERQQPGTQAASQAEAVQPEPAQPEPAQPEAAQPEAAQPEPAAQPGTRKIEPDTTYMLMDQAIGRLSDAQKRLTEAQQAAASSLAEAQTLIGNAMRAAAPEAPTNAAPEKRIQGTASDLPARRAAAGAHAEPGANGVQKNGHLRVEGVRLLNASGQPIQLKGMSTHGLHWYPQYTNREAIRSIKNAGANLFRIAMYADSNAGGYNQHQNAKGINLHLLDIAVENSLAEDMYTIIDWHLLKDRNPLFSLDSAKDFFTVMSQRYADNPAILYEICNEPNGATTWEDIRRYAHEIIPIIRKHSPNAVILVGTPKYSYDVASVTTAPLPYPNIMYSFHLYPHSGKNDYARMVGRMLEQGYPIFVTEWGVDTQKKTGELALEDAAAFLEFMHKHSLSWANWSLSNKDEPFSAIKPTVTKMSGWTEDDLTPSGKLVFKAFRE